MVALRFEGLDECERLMWNLLRRRPAPEAHQPLGELPAGAGVAELDRELRPYHLGLRGVVEVRGRRGGELPGASHLAEPGQRERADQRTAADVRAARAGLRAVEELEVLVEVRLDLRPPAELFQAGHHEERAVHLVVREQLPRHGVRAARVGERLFVVAADVGDEEAGDRVRQRPVAAATSLPEEVDLVEHRHDGVLVVALDQVDRGHTAPGEAPQRCRAEPVREPPARLGGPAALDHRYRVRPAGPRPAGRAQRAQGQQLRLGRRVPDHGEALVDHPVGQRRIRRYPEPAPPRHGHLRGLQAQPGAPVGLARLLSQHLDRGLPGLDGRVAVEGDLVVVTDRLHRLRAFADARGVVERAAMQLDGLRDRVPPAGADAGSDQRAEGVGGYQFGLAGVAGAGVPAVGGGRVVVRDELHDLTDPVLRDLLQPRGDVGVAARPLRRGEGGVRDVAQQGVLERELHLPGEAGRLAGQDEAAVLQGGERVGDVVAETAAQRLDPEHPAHHGRRLEQPLLGYRQRIDARGQQRVEGVGQRAGPAVGHVRDQLLEEVRVAFRPREDLFAALRVESRGARQAVEQIPAGPLGERP